MGAPTTQLTETRTFSSLWTRLIADNEEKGNECRDLYTIHKNVLSSHLMNPPLSIRARRLLQNVSPNFPVFCENRKLVDVMEIT